MELSKTPFGKDLANLVADRLANCQLAHKHKEYCGRGLAQLSDGSFVYGSVDDGEVGVPILTFDSREKFVDWLSIQSDSSLATSKSFEENIDLERLERYVKYSEKSTRGNF